MDSIFFNNDPPSTTGQQQQQQRAELTEKLLLNNNNNNDDFNNNNNNNNIVASYPVVSSQQQQYYSPRRQEEQGLIGHQGVVVGSESSSSTGGSSHLFQSPVGNGGGSHHQQQQPQQVQPQYRDVWAAIIFIVVQCIMMYYTIYGISNLRYDHKHYSNHNNNNNNNNNNDDIDSSLTWWGLFYMIILSTLTALMVTCSMVLLLMKYANIFLQITFIFIMIGNLFSILFCIMYGFYYGIIGSILFLIYVLYCARSYYRRLPFAAANLNVALAAITTNYGLFFIAITISILINFVYSILCSIAYFGVYTKHEIDSDEKVSIHRIMILFVIVTYYWTTEVGKNILHVTTAGVMGTFWFVPDDACTFWSPAIYDSFYRSITYSFGSICFGSLVTTILQVLHQWIRDARTMHRRTSMGCPSMILCVLEFLSAFLERIITYFNKWAYVYIGLYGYDYLTAGNKVISLFTDRGWPTIMNDQLVTSVLTLVSTMIGIGAGCVGLLLSIMHPSWVSAFDDSAYLVAFFIPAFIGLAMAFILTSVIAAAVDTVVVAFAEAPMEFERNHPGLSAQMVTAWRHVYPDEFGR